ncbi:hypothetical protein L9F63_007863, partial [Diploptera punctata]
GQNQKHIPQETSTSRHTSTTSEPPSVTTKRMHTTTNEKFAKIKNPQTTTSVPVTQELETSDTPLPHTTLENTSQTDKKFDRLKILENYTSSTADTTTETSTVKYDQMINASQMYSSSAADSTTTRQDQTTTTVIPHYILKSSQTASDVQSTTTESILGSDEILTDVSLGETTTVLSEASSQKVYGTTTLFRTSSEITPSSIVGTSETETTITDAIPTSKSQIVSSSSTTVSPSTMENPHTISINPYYTTPISTISDKEIADTSNQTLSEITTTEYISNLSNDRSTKSVNTTYPNYDDTTETDEETTLDQIFFAVTEFENTTSNTSSLAIINQLSTTSDETETTTDAVSHHAITESQNTTVRSKIVVSSSPIATTYEETTTDDLISHVSFGVTPTVTTYEESTTDDLISHVSSGVTPTVTTYEESTTDDLISHVSSGVTPTELETTTDDLISHVSSGVTPTEETTTDDLISHISSGVTPSEETTTGGLISHISSGVPPTEETTTEETTTGGLISHISSGVPPTEETTTDGLISHISSGVPPTEETTTDGLIYHISSGVTPTEETTTDGLISHISSSVTPTEQTTTYGLISHISSDIIPTEETTIDGLISDISSGAMDSQNSTVSTDEETSIPAIVLEAVLESMTTIQDELSTPAVVQTTNKHVIEDNEICQTSECKVVASRMLSMMNHSMEPCDNFYEFACGGLRDNHALLQEDPTQDVWNRIASAVKTVNNKSNPIFQKFRHFYDQCVNYERTINQSERLRLARKLVRDVDKMYDKFQWIQADSNFNLTDLLVKLFLINSAPLFDVTVDVNNHDPTKFQLKLTVPRSKNKLQLESPSVSRCKAYIFSDDPHNISLQEVYEKNYQSCVKDFSEYLITMEKAIKEMELYDNTTAYNISQNIGAIKFFIDFYVFPLLEEISNPWELRTNILEKKFTLMTVNQLTNMYPQVNWKILFSALLNEPVTVETEVQVYFENYFDKLFERLNESLSNATTRLNIHNGLLGMLAHDIYVDLVKENPCNRPEYCLRIASGLMEDVSSSLYLSTFTSKELSDKEHELVIIFDQLKNILKEEIMQSGWLDEESRSSLEEKLDKMEVKADGGRAILSDPNYLRNQLNDQYLSTSNNYFENVIQLQRRYRKLLYYLVTYETDPSVPEIIWTFFHLPYDVHPISVYQLNTV